MLNRHNTLIINHTSSGDIRVMHSTLMKMRSTNSCKRLCWWKTQTYLLTFVHSTQSKWQVWRVLEEMRGLFTGVYSCSWAPPWQRYLLSICQRSSGASKVCPEGTPIPSEQWVRLQFYPQNPRTKTAELYRMRLPVKMMVQKTVSEIAHWRTLLCCDIPLPTRICITL